MYFSVKKLIHHPRKRLYNLIKTCNIKKKKGKKRKKNVGAMPASKRRNLTTKSSSWERLGPRISCVWWNFPENGHRISPFVANHVHSRPDSGSLTYLRSHFSTRKMYTVKKNLSYGNPFSRRSFFHCYAQVSIHLRGNIDCRNECQNKTTSCSRFLSYFRVEIFSILPVYNLEQVTSISIISNGFY